MLRSTCLVALAAMSSLPAIAQVSEEADAVQDVIYVEGLRPAEIGETTGAVITIDPTIRNTPNIADSLRAAPGVAISRSGNLGSLTQVRIRGAEANHTLVTYEGIEVSDPVTGETDFGLLTALPVGRVDVLRGPASSIHGSDAIGGVVALRAPEEVSLVSGNVEIGSFDTYRGAVGVASSLNDGTRFNVSASALSTDGVDASGLDGEKDGSDALNVSSSLNATLGNWNFGALGLLRHTTSQTDPDTDFDGRLDNADRLTHSDQQIFGLTAITAYGQIDHHLSASYNKITREDEADGNFIGETEGTRTKAAWSPSWDVAGNGVHTLTGLAEIEQETYERFSTDTLFGNPNQKQDFTSQSLGADYRYAADRVTLTASARQDFNDSLFDDASTWRLGGAFDLTGETRLRASGGEGIKNPTFTELYGYFPGSFVGNPDLQPEKSLGWDVGIDHGMKIGEAAITVSLTYFEANLEDEIYTAFNPDFTSTALNAAGESQRSGVEISTSALIGPLGINAQYTNTTSETAQRTAEIRVPEDTASLSLDWQMDDAGLMPNARLACAFDYVGEQLDIDFGTFSQVTLDAYTLASARIDLPVSPNIDVTFRGENLLDEEIIDVFGYHGPGAGVFLGLTFK